MRRKRKQSKRRIGNSIPGALYKKVGNRYKGLAGIALPDYRPYRITESAKEGKPYPKVKPAPTLALRKRDGLHLLQYSIPRPLANSGVGGIDVSIKGVRTRLYITLITANFDYDHEASNIRSLFRRI